MLRDPDLKRLLERVVGHLVPASEIEDVVQDTLEAAHDTPNLPAGRGKERDNYVCGIAQNMAVDNRRRAGRFPALGEEESVEERMGQHAAGHVAQAVDASIVDHRDFLAKLTVDLPEDQQLTFQCMSRHMLGEDLTQIAREVGVPYPTLYKRVTTLHQRTRAKARRMMIGLPVVLLALGLSWHVLQPKPQLAADEPQAVRLLSPAISTHVGETDPMDWARVLRGEAFKACMNDQWRECLQGLDAAWQLDPDGDDHPAVKAARADAWAGIGAGLKAGSTWAPPRVRVYAPWAAR